jgi:hypothetical protein
MLAIILLGYLAAYNLFRERSNAFAVGQDQIRHPIILIRYPYNWESKLFTPAAQIEPSSRARTLEFNPAELIHFPLLQCGHETTLLNPRSVLASVGSSACRRLVVGSLAIGS